MISSLSKAYPRALNLARCGKPLQESLAPEVGHLTDPTWAALGGHPNSPSTAVGTGM